MDTNMTFRMDSQTKAKMTDVRVNGMPFPVKLDTPAPTTVTRSQMLADADEILSDSAQDYKRMAE